MKRFWIVLSAMGIVLATGTLLTPQAQVPQTKLGFVNVARVLTMAPGGSDFIQQQAQAQARVQELQSQIVSLEAKVRTGLATQEEQQQLASLRVTAQAEVDALNAQLAAIREPLEMRINDAIQEIGRDQDFTIIFSFDFVQQNRNLILYVDPDADITDAIVAEVQ